MRPASPPAIPRPTTGLESGETPAVEADYAAALAADPTDPHALVGLAERLLLRGAPDRAVLLLRRCCGVMPELPLARVLLGLALLACGDPAAAVAAFAEAQRLEPWEYGHALHRIMAAKQAGQADIALAQLERESLADPLDVVTLTARGALLERVGRIEEAVDLLEAAVMIAPESSVPALELANALMRGVRGEAAEAALARAIALVPDEPMLCGNHAVVLMRLHRHREAAAELRAVMAAHGETPAGLCNLSTALTALGEQEEAVEAARAATALAPQAHLPWRSMVNAVAYRDGVTAREMLEIGRRAAEVVPRETLGELGNTPEPDRRLRVGLLSQTLKSHPVGWFTVAAVENLDPRQFEIVCIGQSPTNDPIERRFRAVAAAWHEADVLQRTGFAAAIRALGIDVLIELSGYGDRGMMAVCASRAAPVQIKWVGMQNHSSALPEMDWFVTDRWETPPGSEAGYSERLMRMPDGYVVYSPPPYAPDVATLPALRHGAVTFGCFNNIAKVTPRVIACWAAILTRLPQARLVLKTHQMEDAQTAARVTGAFGACGVAADRIELRGASPHRMLLQQYGDIDIVLDPFPYAGGLTTCEALWMGVQTITPPGETFSSRHATSHMSNVGLADWVAEDIDAYIEMAVRRGSDIGALVPLRAGLRARMAASPLCDGLRFGRHLGAALRAAWRDWCARQSGP